MAIMRMVIETKRMDRIGFAPGGFGIINILECGHTVCTKGSAGYAKKRRCRQCELLKAGGINTIIGNGEKIVETWDENKQMPKRTVSIKDK